eukprot:TRINITY_DN23342_c0_g1_i1.p1 TRINITY_DN23342_c0_g1~~TRINITY_DN23342_c0_g1_i1.p1  ORF type:complete len:1258 (+),score=289.26 TRINITY_DN23342_c0_g1_i1:123-3896(+)
MTTLALHQGGQMVPAGGMAGNTSATMASMAAGTSGQPPVVQRMAQVDRAPQPSGKRQVGVVEMLEFCKSLDIDPVKESEMLWIAEEAFHAPLPMGWTEHTNELGHTYFHNLATGVSVWQHPMDKLYRKIVEYYRKVVQIGGFWTVEDDIAELEEKIRQDLGKWMELFDENGEKYYFNKDTRASQLDDPRNELYHDLYARIKMVAKMKERLPLLARAPRPEEPTAYELRLRKIQEEEEAFFLKCVIQIQSLSRMVAAKMRVKALRAKREMGKGPQPLRGRLCLRLKELGPERKTELVLRETTPHRRNKAAARIQSVIRMKLQLLRFRPKMEHHRYMCQEITKVQRLARRFLARRRRRKAQEMKLHRAVTCIAAFFRGRKGRKTARGLRQQRENYAKMIRSTIKIQTRARMLIAKRVVQEVRVQKYTSHVMALKGAVKSFAARKELIAYLPGTEPCQLVFAATEDEKAAGLMPYTWRLLIAPTDPHTGTLLQHRSKYLDLFHRRAPTHVEEIACEHVQRLVRGFVARQKFKRRVEMARTAAMRAIEVAATEARRRNEACTRIQTVFRGWYVRYTNVLQKRYLMWVERRMAKIKRVQAQIRVFNAQASLTVDMANLHQTLAVIRIQKMWRGYMARRHYEMVVERAMWPLKTWFDYTGTGPNSAYVTVRFLPNPRFDGMRYFLGQTGFEHALAETLKDMQKEVDTCVDAYLESVQVPPQPEEEEIPIPPPKPKEDAPAEEGKPADGAAPADRAGGASVPAAGTEGAPAAGADGQAPAATPSPDGAAPADAEGNASAVAVARTMPGEAIADGGGAPADGAVAEGGDAGAESGAAGGGSRPTSATGSEATSAATGRLGTSPPEPPVQVLEPIKEPPVEVAVQTTERELSAPVGGAAPAAGETSAPAEGGEATEADTTQLEGADATAVPEEPLPAVQQRSADGFGTFEEGRADALLKMAQFEAQVDKAELANPSLPPDAPRKHYEGEKGKPDLTNMSEEERQRVLQEIEAKRKKKVDELMRKQKKIEAKKRKEAKKAAAELKAKREAEALQKKLWHEREQEKERRRLEAEIMQKMRIKAQQQAAALDRFQQEQAHFRERRMRIAEGRRQNFDRGMALRGGPSMGPSMHSMPSMGPSMGPSVALSSGPSVPRGYPFPPVGGAAGSQASLGGPSTGPQRVLHRHVHHHMHYHSGTEGEMMLQPDHNATQLPAISADVAGAGVLPAVDGMRRSGSDPSLMPVVTKQPPTSMPRSASTGYVRPIDGGL